MHNATITASALDSQASVSCSEGGHVAASTTGSLLKYLKSLVSTEAKSSEGSEILSELSKGIQYTKSTALSAAHDSFDMELTAITSESYIAIFNIASLAYTSHQYVICHTLLERLLKFVTDEPQDNGITIKICFLLLEVLLRQYNNVTVGQSREKANLLQTEFLRIVSTAVDNLSHLHQNSHDSSDDSDISPSISRAIDLRNLLESVLKFKMKVYSTRLYIAIGNIHDARLQMISASTIFEENIQPTLITSSNEMILTDSYRFNSISSALVSYIGLITAELPVDMKIVRRSLTNLKKSLINIQVCQ